MLDNGTKRRIDTARDILVGKLPDPKSQVEQITIALIYKFMDDMDAQSVEYGGDPSFFVGDYEKYGWRKLFSPRVGGHELLALYGESIVKLNQNPQLPQLFRDIFKNAYLPYRDPETLKLFLKTINEFKYDHSERLGDAFEYLLSVLGSQGDAGQFRTPRHIIDFIVEVVQPRKEETVCDPACGTAGFLISSYKYILRNNTRQQNGDMLTPDDRRRLMQNFVGYDISPDMVRLSLVNLYLHGFPDPHIYEYDTLTSEDRWNESFDVVMANPPFMSPKGGIKPHKKFSLQANRSEVLFVDYIAEHINPVSGRAGVIVPEGIIFQSANAYKDLRKMLVEKAFLYAVVSLPAGVFNPYSGVKTSILFFDKTLAAKSDKILFVKIADDGFGLGAQRKQLKTSDLPDALNVLLDFQKAIAHGDTSRFENIEELPSSVTVEKRTIAASGDYNLSADRYRASKVHQSKYEMFSVEDLIDDVRYTTKVQKSDFLETGRFPIVDQSEKFIAGFWNNEDDVFRIEKPVIAFGDHTRVFKYLDFDFVLGADGIKLLKPSKKIDSKFFFYCLKNLEIENLGYSRHYKELKDKKIPLPPLTVQKEIVERVEGYQRLINGAKQVVQSFKPNISLNPEWQIVKLDEMFRTKSGTTPSRSRNDYFEDGHIAWVKTLDLNDSAIHITDEKITKKALDETHLEILPKGTVLIAMYGGFNQIGRTGVLEIEATTNQAITALLPNEKVNPYFLNSILVSSKEYWKQVANSTRKDPNITKSDILRFKIPLPPLEEQKQIVAQIEHEQSLVNANKELITIYEQKIKDEINKLWEM
jgi:type I restriction enzyme M protein